MGACSLCALFLVLLDCAGTSHVDLPVHRPTMVEIAMHVHVDLASGWGKRQAFLMLDRLSTVPPTTCGSQMADRLLLNVVRGLMCLGTEGNAEAPVRSPGGSTGLDAGVTWGCGTSITALQERSCFTLGLVLALHHRRLISEMHF